MSGSGDGKKISIIIVNWNVADLLRQCLCSLRDDSDGLPVESIVVDNNSSDGSADMVREEFPEVVLIENRRNCGFAAANNIALRVCASEYVLLLNPDTVVRRGMLAGLAGYMDANPEVGIAGPKVVGKDGSVLGSARTFPTLRTAFFGGKTLLRKMLGGSGAARYEIPCLYHDCLDPLPVDWVIGACMFIRKSVLDQACLLDERFFMYWEDADLCKRAAEHGWKVYWLPEFEVMHICEAASNASLLAVARTTFEFHRSVYLYFCKHLKSNPLLPLAVFPLVYARMLIKLPITLLREIIKKYLK